VKARNSTGRGDYVSYLGANPSEIDILCQEILINVTSFFREPDAFEALKKHEGFLLSGASETIGLFGSFFAAVGKKSSIYRRKAGAEELPMCS
jgi:chemotaxis methyl-accepting protein methylase